jgi:hypothetical protein
VVLFVDDVRSIGLPPEWQCGLDGETISHSLFVEPAIFGSTAFGTNVLGPLWMRGVAGG